MIAEQDLNWLLSNATSGDDSNCIVIVPRGYNILVNEAFGRLGLHPIKACKFHWESDSYHYLVETGKSKYRSFRSLPKIFELKQEVHDHPTKLTDHEYHLEEHKYSYKQ